MGREELPVPRQDNCKTTSRHGSKPHETPIHVPPLSSTNPVVSFAVKWAFRLSMFPFLPQAGQWNSDIPERDSKWGSEKDGGCLTFSPVLWYEYLLEF